ncbi:MAG: hypothetical protein HGB10_00610 [Coriobacteriia bacterium]|nr:hypothetical protein [Coriobacteriia bacterium]
MFTDRQEALAALGTITGDPGFSDWESEVVLVDLGLGTPVLLVRPSTADHQDAAADVVVTQPVDEAVFAALADDDELALDTEPAAASDSASEPASEHGPSNDLRDAIARSMAEMESSGIVVPESVPGHSEDSSAVVEEAIEPAVDEIVPESEAASPDVDQPEASLVTDGGEWPWAVSDAEPQHEASVGTILEGLEDPAIDDRGGLIITALPAEHPEIEMPDFVAVEVDEVAVEPVEVAAFVEEAAEAPMVDSDDESDFIVLEAPAAPEQPAGAEPVAVEVPAPVEAPVDARTAELLGGYTCSDCVYVDTCPNKDQRRPEDCGSFQWR